MTAINNKPNLKLAVAQFEPKNGDKAYNLDRIIELTEKAKLQGAEVISFHELSVTAYTHLQELSYEAIRSLAEKIPDGPSTRKLISISKQFDIPILAGLVELDGEKIYNTYLCVTSEGLVAKYRKLHPFISKYLSQGQQYCVFPLLGWKCGILICYDNNIIENVRATSLLGAELIFAPHVTGCTPSSMPGRGFVDHKYWEHRHNDPDALRKEFDGLKGREWLMRWLPSRAYDNGVYYAFSNPIGYDGDQLKNGNSMIIDPFGTVLSEIRSFQNDVTVALIHGDKLSESGGWRYRKARRPELYRDIISREHESVTRPIWMGSQDGDN